MIETRRLKNAVIFIQTVLRFVLLRKIIQYTNSNAIVKPAINSNLLPPFP